MANVELLRETMDYIKNNPQKWRQDSWYAWVNEAGQIEYGVISLDMEEVNSCGSAFCFAGHAALKSGFPAPPRENHRQWTKAEEVDGYTQNVHVDEFAREKLGLTWEQAEVLFSGDNTLEDLEKIVDAIIDDPEIGEIDLLILVDRYNDYCCDECAGYTDDDEDDEDSW